MYKVAPNRSASPTVSVVFFFISNAQVAFAPSTCLRLAIQAFFWLNVRALTKLGMAIAANKPMIATTIMISTRVNPALVLLVIFICCSRREPLQKAGLYNFRFGSQYAFCQPLLGANQQRECHPGEPENAGKSSASGLRPRNTCSQIGQPWMVV